MSAPALDRRRVRSEQTRETLRRCALARFAQQGFAGASVAEIAGDAGVTERTFYRYFPTKEAVLFQDFASRLEWFRAALELRPGDEPLLDSVRVAVESFPDDREVVRQVARLRASLLTGDVIAEQLRRVQGGFAAEIERHALRRLGDGPEARLQAAVLGNAAAGALLAALRVFGERGGRDTDELRGLVRQALDLLRRPAGRATGRAAG
ncbi:MAG TPA: TetR family transcriptional regulator [Myxococcota bacterium]|nr:TetR family transcriptional regulator [Myxococcota bacterium]